MLLQDQRKQTLTVWLANFTTQKGTEWGPLMAGATLTALPVVVSSCWCSGASPPGSPPAPCADDARRPRACAAACLLPSFPGLDAPDWALRWVEAGVGGVVLFATNVRDAEQVAGCRARLRGLRGDTLVSVDEEGGDVTRLFVRGGSPYPGPLALGVLDDVDADAVGSARRSAPSCGRPAST